MLCDVCGQEFEPNQHNQTRCSQVCRRKASRRRLAGRDVADAAPRKVRVSLSSEAQREALRRLKRGEAAAVIARDLGVTPSPIIALRDGARPAAAPAEAVRVSGLTEPQGREIAAAAGRLRLAGTWGVRFCLARPRALAAVAARLERDAKRADLLRARVLTAAAERLRGVLS